MGPTTAAQLMATAGSERLDTAIREVDTKIYNLQVERCLLVEARGLAVTSENDQNGRVTREQVRNAMASYPSGITPTELSNHFASVGLSNKAAHNHLARLVTDGLVVSDGNGRYALAVAQSDIEAAF